ncbi:PREDICTED: DNA-directed RNA polymerase III subunit RPC4 [Ceratosolen solmsi marchali]|uniref:DNA-directed RNA polymerase III subunit RPC4 n=1 Tax=Ceratosolen solmsi marchali TaxID=326594 RepID=A0AAJ6YN64_9HYME|nr:PREDICTED: DNA-directed RNA polymerase III subunit RPC4 [Ceratosolen solmsi marchali]
MMMSSNGSNIPSEYNPNIKIKEEIGTVSTPSTSTSPITLNAMKTVKTEFSFPSTLTPTRLPSFRVPRDLTLGGNVKFERSKKVYVPNLNAQRNKNREDQNIANKNESNPKVNKGRHDRGKSYTSKGIERNNLYQSTGIFSEGISDKSTKRHIGVVSSIFRDKSFGNGKEAGITLERPKLCIPQKINKAEEAEKLKELLRDDFIDDRVDFDLENAPVGLPMINEGKVFKTESNQSVSISKYQNSINLQNGVLVKTGNKIKLITPKRHINEGQVPLNVVQVMENKSSTFILMQLPDCLPGLQTDKQNNSRLKGVPESNSKSEMEKSNKFCTLNNLKEGILGKLQVLRSGKTRLLLGENDLIIDVGSNLSFRQDLIAVKISGDKQSGNLVNLGPVNSTLICSPDWENMLKNI